MLPTRHVRLSLRIGWFLICGLPAQATTAQEGREPVLVAPSAETAAIPHNIQVVVSETFLNRLIARQESKPGEVRDRFRNTEIVGRQTTATRLGIDVQPSQNEGRLLVVLEGDSCSSTSGYSPQAVVVQSVGHQQFRATKEVLFDGYQLTTRHAVLSVQAENQNVGALTRFTCSPLGPLVEQAVLGAARFRQPAAEAFARQRVIERVYPRFEGDLDAQLASGNKLLKETLPTLLKTARLTPNQIRVSSTDTQMRLAASMALPAKPVDVPPVPAGLTTDHGISFYLHESLLQGIIEGSGFEGRITSTGKLTRLLRLGGLTVEDPETDRTAEDDDVEIEFAQVDPLVIRIGEEEMRITLRATFKPAGEDHSPVSEVTIPLRLEKNEGRWALQPGTVEVRRLSHHSDKKSISELVMKKRIEARLPNIRFPQQILTKLWPEGKAPPRISSIRSGQSWLVIGID